MVVCNKKQNESEDKESWSLGTKGLTLIRLGFFDIFRFGEGGCRPPIIFVVCGLTATKFCTGIDNQSMSSNMEKNLHKINDVIIVRKLAEKTVKRV